jgi:hypothetical protein
MVIFYLKKFDLAQYYNIEKIAFPALPVSFIPKNFILPLKKFRDIKTEIFLVQILKNFGNHKPKFLTKGKTENPYIF